MSQFEPYMALVFAALWGGYGWFYFTSSSKKKGKEILLTSPPRPAEDQTAPAGKEGVYTHRELRRSPVRAGQPRPYSLDWSGRPPLARAADSDPFRVSGPAATVSRRVYPGGPDGGDEPRRSPRRSCMAQPAPSIR